MSKTLFWYLLKDLLRVFLMAAMTLAGIMSFGALLRPLMQYGLNASQVGRILSYFSPAMTTYSLPVGALFATTFVYGRLSADNELTACRASGISHLAMTWPAVLLGLLVALISLLFLSFIVPLFTLKVEQVIYSNIAQLVATRISRTHEVSYGKTTIFAQGATVITLEEMVFIPGDPDLAPRLASQLETMGHKARLTTDGVVVKYERTHWRSALNKIQEALGPESSRQIRIAWVPARVEPEMRQQMLASARTLPEAIGELPPHEAQIVDLDSPMIFSYMTVDAPDVDLSLQKHVKEQAPKMRVPTRILIARRATAYITQTPEGVELQAVLDGGSSFPRGAGGSQTLLERAQFGPVQFGSPIREKTKFMDITQLKEVLARPESSRRLKGLVKQFVREEQRRTLFLRIQKELAESHKFQFKSETESLVVHATDMKSAIVGDELILNPRGDEGPRVRVERERDGAVVSTDSARQVRISVDPVELEPGAVPLEGDPRRMVVTVRGFDVDVEVPHGQAPVPHETFPRTINMPMPVELQESETRSIPYYLSSAKTSTPEHALLMTEYERLMAGIRAEMHSRASFAVSCFILVLVGAALGMVSRSGNFLSAFAVSVVPALLCIALIVTGQHVCENTPRQIKMGLGLVWSGNVIVLILATFLLGRLQRQ